MRALHCFTGITLCEATITYSGTSALDGVFQQSLVVAAGEAG
jgi:hypothetical protein